MSRKWERMVQKNTKLTNKARVKQGKPTLSEAASDGSVTVRGRSWLMPLLLICVGIFCFIAFYDVYQNDNLYWVTGGSYIALGLFIFWLRRPFLKIGGKELVSRRFGGDKRVEAAQIKEILLQKDAVVISLTTSKTKWVFTKLYHRFDIGSLSETLKEFAERNGVALRNEQAA
ncbi:hypothetical protein N0M98_13470 [Paenibacillus doosanensis]|uniref:hypothetical protein n=1 Tax=Paenibacillus doosanensis TaxID=1229154 RepID=UPI00217FDB7D|nr:hypothetical protein [Paenibacillus doosanensis]MCS7461158.1 hypothetical protein [Paenibacillus doosanensis]